MEYIDSADNKKIKEWASLTIKKNRQKAGKFLLESIRGIQESLIYGFMPEYLLLREDIELPVFISQKESIIKVVRLSRKAFSKLSTTENSQGVIGVYLFKTDKLSELLSKKNIIFLDSIQDPGNLGTIVRSAAAFDIGGIILGPGCVDLYNEKVLRSTLGGIFALPVIVADYEDLRLFAKHGFNILGAGLEGEDLSKLKVADKVLVGIGNENRGLSQDFLKYADKLLTIRISNKMESLNASIAAGIIMYELNN